MNTTQYYIGLKKYGQKWVWLSDNSTLEETETGKFPWATGQPMGDGNCATSCALYLSPKTMKPWRPCWWFEQIPWEVNLFFMQPLSSVP